jgi:hypothetical protein
MRTKENQTARTTIVGGGPPGSGRCTGTIPRGIEVLVKKAAVDPAFRELLFEQRGAAATGIGLELDPAENAMLSAIPREQLAQIVSETTVPDEQRRVFLGRLAVAMLAVIGGSLAGCEDIEPHIQSAGIRPRKDDVWPDQLKTGVTNAPSPPTRGVQPDHP